MGNKFDFGSAHRQDTKSGLNQKGLYTFDRRPKDTGHYEARRGQSTVSAPRLARL